MTDKDTPRFLLTAVIILYFGYGLYAHWSEGLEETLKNIVMLAIGFWLGSSKGSADKSTQIERMEAAQTGTPDNPTVIEGVHGGETVTIKQEAKKG